MKKIQISQELFFKLVQYHIFDVYEFENEIKKELEQKVDSLSKREIYTKYKTAHSEEEREKARQEYLEKVGIPEAFRW